MTENVHIVCLDAPSPPDYGGAIDMYYKIVSLAATGIKVNLHYFNYRGGRDIELIRPYCSQVNAYERKGFVQSASTLPYIVRSRINKKLIDNLNRDEAPVLLEGIHCSGILPFIKNSGRVILRMHNEESSYYLNLSKTEKNYFKKTYYQIESTLLRRYYKRLHKDLKIACISDSDLEVFENEFGFRNLHLLPSFIPWQSVKKLEGKGSYCLYHGNLSVSENEAAAIWLVDQVFSRTELKFIIAGKQPSKLLAEKTRSFANIQLLADPSEEEIDMLISNAHVNILPSFNTTGVKLKILHALFNGRYCISNSNGLNGLGLDAGIILAETPGEYIRILKDLVMKDFDAAEQKNRQKLLTVYNNHLNAVKLNALW